ncbi:hypothetical protein [Bifidobacterium angulatum]|nr:hypothetical protein [Bifidobacterium angulatum]KFI38958.1 hypothetical protein BIANG_0138 [Bifidobacterium angulatum]BAQ96309.1 hypothetical protein BBAG_0687 [Bifidobacterium angulatum DSM 20098 = JCM 7096]
MRDRNAYENSSVWNMVSEIKQDEYINSLSPGMRNYLMYLLEDIERRKNTNCYYVSESTLNTLNNDLRYIRDYLSSSSLESYINQAFEHLASSWPAHNGRRVVDIAQSTYNHYVDEAEKRIKEIRDQADKIDSLKDEFDDFLESTKNEIVETKEVMEKRTDEIEEATNARRKEMGEQYEDFLVSAKENAEKSIEQITESYLKNIKEINHSAEILLEQVQKRSSSISGWVIADSYGKYARNKTVTTLVYDILAIAFSVVGIFLVGFALNAVEDKETAISVFRVTVSIASFTIAGFLFRRGTFNQREAKSAKRTELTLRQYEPFIANLETEDKKSITKEIAERIFVKGDIGENESAVVEAIAGRGFSEKNLSAITSLLKAASQAESSK